MSGRQNERLAPGHLCGVSEIALAFGVSEKTAREWISEGMPCLFIGKKWQGKYDDIWEWLKKREGLKVVK